MVARLFRLSRPAQGFLLGLAATLIWGCQYSVSRFIFGETAGDAVDPYLVSAWRFLTGAIALTPFLFAAQGWKKSGQALRHDFPTMALLAVAGVGAEGLLAFYSLKYTPAARSSLLCNLSPVFTVVLAAFVARRMPNRWKWLGCILGVVGLSLVLSTASGDIYDASPRTLPGDLMALSSGMAWAFYTVFGGRSSQKYGGVPCTFATLLIAGVVMALVALCHGAEFFPALGWQAWGGVLFLGIIGTGLSIGLWCCATCLIDPAALGAFGYLSASIALCLARLCAHEHFTWQFLAAFVLSMTAISLMNR